MNGKGQMLYENGCTYKGDFANDEPHGQGVYTWTNGASYEGGFVNGV